MSENVTSQAIHDESTLAGECLFQARALCVDIRNNGRFLDQRAIDADGFLARTSSKYMPMVMRCQECRDRLSAIDFIKTANSANLQPIHFSDWTVTLAHEAACRLLQDTLLQYDQITGWDERGSLRGIPCTEREKREDCQRLVRWATTVSDEFIDGIQAKIEIENAGANRWLSEQTAKQVAPLPAATANDARDEWIYDLAIKTIAWGTIRRRLNKKPKSWGRFVTDNGVKKAAIAYAKRQNLPAPSARKAGRPEQKKNTNST